MPATITAAAILASVCLIASLGESCSDRYAGGILPGAAIVVAALIIGGLICR